MLQAIRDKVSGWIAYAIILLISIPFALFGVNSYLGGGAAVVAATVNGEDISVRVFDTAYASYRQRLASVFGGTIPAAFSDESILKNQVLSQLIEEFTLRQYVVKQGYRIGDEALGNMIRAEQAFQADGRFDQSIYQAQIGSLGYSTAGFEQEFRQNQVMLQLQAAIDATAFVVPERRKQFTSLSSQSRKIRMITRLVNMEGLGISDTEVEDYYEANAIRYMTPEQVKIDYLELNLETIKSLVEVEQERVLDRYQQTVDSYTSEGYRKASHILLALEDGVSEEDSEKTRQRLLELKKQIEATNDFASAAREFSDDLGSAAEGGNLGKIERGMMVEPFEDAVFRMREGELSEPVKTVFGWHLIKLEQIAGVETRTFEDVRSEIEDEIKSEMAENQIFDILEILSNMAYEQPESLLPAADQLGLKLLTSEWFDRISGVGIASAPKIRAAAFSNEILREGINSEAIELADNRILFIRLNTFKPAQQMSLDKVRNVIVAELKAKQARDKNSQLGDEALEILKSGASLEQVAVDWDLEIVDLGFIERDSLDINREILQLVFSMGKPAPGPVFEGLVQSNGEYALVELSGVLSNDSEADSDSIQGLTTATAAVEYQAVLKALASEAEVVKTAITEFE